MADDYGSQIPWMERAACSGDWRFTEPPDESLTEELERICLGCEVFTECRDYHELYQATDVFAHGMWRYGPTEEEG